MNRRKRISFSNVKGLLLLLVTSLPLAGYAQPVPFTKDSIPLVDGRVVFKVNFRFDLKKEEFHKKADIYLNEVLNPYSGIFRVNNQDLSVCQITDYVSIQNSLFQTFGMYMTYDLQLSYKNDSCNMVINRIRYVDKGSFEAHEDDPRHNRNVREWSGKEIMVDKNYSLMFVKEVSERITEAALKRINDIIAGLDAVFKKN